MDPDPTRGVTDADGRFHHAENLYVAGPALFPSIGSPNPMLTGIALSRRTGDLILAPPPFAPDPGFEVLFDGTALGDWTISTISFCRSLPRAEPATSPCKRCARHAAETKMAA
jgi:hypothetical protein